MSRNSFSRKRLLTLALIRFVAGLLSVGLLVFLPAGTLDYWQAWLYMGILFVPLAIMAIVMLLKDPKLLERRMRMMEGESAQRKAIARSTLVLLALYVIPGLDRRFGWSSVPTALVLLAMLLVLMGFGLFAFTLRENRYASRVVEVQEKQPVVRTGPYALVRHPMYLAMVLILGFTPLALGSYRGMMAGALFPLTLVGRIANEEELLRNNLLGYVEYCEKVKYRVFPYVW